MTTPHDEIGFALNKGNVIFNTPDGRTIHHGGSPVGILLDASSGFIKTGTISDLNDRRSLQIAGARLKAPSLVDDLERDLVIFKIEPTTESVARANMALHSQGVAQKIAASLRDGLAPAIAV